MPDPIAAWRATYTPGNWVVLAGPTSMVVLQPAPARVSDLLNRFWGDVLQSRSIHEVSAQIARHNLSQLASFGLLFWDEAGLHALTRGALRIMNPDTGEQLASGENVVTWTETALGRDGSVLIEMEPVAPDVLRLPLIVGAATASSVFLTTHPDFLVRSVQSLVIPESSGDASEVVRFSGAPAPAASEVAPDQTARPGVGGTEMISAPVSPVIGAAGLAVAAVPVFGADDQLAAQGADQVQMPGENRLDEEPLMQPVESSESAAEPFSTADQTSPVEQLHGTEQVEPVAEEFGDFSFSPMEEASSGMEEVSSGVGHDDFSFAPVAPATPVPSAPVPGAAAPMQFPIGQQSGLISAVVCAEGHPNPVGSQGCRQCNSPVGQIPRLVPRPVVAIVRSNFGVALDLSSPIFIGRAPDTMGDPSAQVIKVPSPSTDISRSHLRIAPNDWQIEVTDLNSTNGSTITLPGQIPTRLEPGIPTSVPLGTSLDLGDGVQISIELPS